MKSVDESSLSLAQQVDAVGDRFESAWKAGQRPRIEEFLYAVDSRASPATEQSGVGHSITIAQTAEKVGEVDPGYCCLRPSVFEKALAHPPEARTSCSRRAFHGPRLKSRGPWQRLGTSRHWLLGS
jgi:hypothetical protein